MRDQKTELLQGQLARYEAQAQIHLEAFKGVAEAGKEALNALLLINGGAVVALLGFISAVQDKSLPAKSGSLALADPLLLFGGGVFCGALAFGLRYFAQLSNAATDARTRRVPWFNGASIFVAGIGYLSFAVGLWYSYLALKNLLTP